MGEGRRSRPGRVLVSGCLGGRPIRYDGSGVDVASAVWDEWVVQGRLVHLCPELAVGFPVPRPPAEIVGGSAADVLNGRARVRESGGRDVTPAFRSMAERIRRLVRENDVVLAVLVDASPTCGSTVVYDGSFTGRRVPGRGVAAEILERMGVRVFTERQLDAAATWLAQLER